MQKAVFQTGAAHFDMLSQLEFALKGATGDALMQIGGFGPGVAVVLAADGQDAVTNLDAQILLAEAGDRDADAVMSLVG